MGQGRALDIMLSARQVTVDEALLEQGLFVDGEAAEGIRAFIAKRAPDFAREIAPRPG